MNLFLNFEHYDLAIRIVDGSKNWCEHLDIQFIYKILWLELF